MLWKHDISKHRDFNPFLASDPNTGIDSIFVIQGHNF